jgi:hypothetical protein
VRAAGDEEEGGEEEEGVHGADACVGDEIRR